MRLPAVLLLLLVASVSAASPADAVAAALKDCGGLASPTDQKNVRYLTLHAVPEDRKETWRNVLSGHVNGLSPNALRIPRKIDDDLFAVDLRDYAWKREVWERLAKVDPYFHVTLVKRTTVKKYWPGGKWTDGRHWDAGTYDEVAVTEDRTTAPWVDGEAYATLSLLTKSDLPVARADWFFNQTAIQEDRVAGYYDFLNLGKKQKDFDALVGIDSEKLKVSKRTIAALTAKSGVTLQNRFVFRSGDGPGAWVTFDYRKSINGKNVIANLDKDLNPPEEDASEQYGFLPNNLFAFWLRNGADQRQNIAPDFIASNRVHGMGNDSRIHIGMSCIRCHVEGLRPIKDYMRRVYKDAGRLSFGTPDRERNIRALQLYFSDLESEMQDDVRKYSRALFRATGMKPAEYAKAYGAAWDWYQEEDVTAEQAARELGTTKEHFLKALQARANINRKAAGKGVKIEIGLPPPLEEYLSDDSEGLRREHWEEVYGVAQQVIREVSP